MATAERWLMVKEMAEQSGFSENFFYKNHSLGSRGRKAAILPPMVKIGRNLRCKASLFVKWLEGPDQGAVPAAE